MRLGEVTLLNLSCFGANLHAKPSDMHPVVDRNGLSQTAIFVPNTKLAPAGEDIFYAKQDGESDPEGTWLVHAAVNTPPTNGPLFAYRFNDTHRPLTRLTFLSVVSVATKRVGCSAIQGHGIRIGGTLEYLLRAVPFDVVKTKGHWASNAFKLYLRRHAQIMALYMQANPHVDSASILYTMPPVR